MIIENPCHIKKENLRISVKGFDWRTRQNFSQKIDPPYEDEIILTSSRPSTISTGIFDLKPDIVLMIFKKGKLSNMIIPSDNLPKLLKNEELFNNLSKYKRKKLMWVFCKAVCSGRIKVISRLNETRKNKVVEEILNRMRKLDKKLIKTKSREELMGIEGNIAKEFYFSLSEFNEEFGSEFIKRDRNNRNLVNILMNFVHTILRNKIQYRLILKGINPYHSFLHNNDRNLAYLSFDFSEFWIAYTDKLIFYSIEKGIIKKGDLKEGRLSKKAITKLVTLINNRIPNKIIDSKIDEFIEYLKGKNRLSWKTFGNKK